MPLRRNRRQYEQLTDIGWSNRRIGRHLGIGNSGSQKVECTVGTQMMIVQSEEWCTNNVASIDSTPLTSFQTSSAIKRNHKETTVYAYH
ncbi:hypothetical protein TNCV_333501 [Trichonephila clavipes]|nr:hypothetical protein TNCV_333501 [Trichonephila clavipes]